MDDLGFLPAPVPAEGAGTGGDDEPDPEWGTPHPQCPDPAAPPGHPRAGMDILPPRDTAATGPFGGNWLLCEDGCWYYDRRLSLAHEHWGADAPIVDGDDVYFHWSPNMSTVPEWIRCEASPVATIEDRNRMYGDDGLGLTPDAMTLTELYESGFELPDRKRVTEQGAREAGLTVRKKGSVWPWVVGAGVLAAAGVAVWRLK